MKKVVCAVFVMILSAACISAVEFEVKDTYASNEMLITSLSGNFLNDIQADNVKLYRNHVQVPVELDVRQINQDFYIAAQLPQVDQATNYSLRINGVEYYAGTQISDAELGRNFTILPASAEFSLSQGIVYTNQGFTLTLQNLAPERITISVSESIVSGASGPLAYQFDASEENLTTITLRSGETRDIAFDISQIEGETFRYIALSSSQTTIQVPTWIVGEASNPEEENETTFEQGDMYFIPADLGVFIAIDSPETYAFTLYNDGENTISDIQLVPSENIRDYVTLNVYEFSELDAGSSLEVEVSAASTQVQRVEGTIEVTTQEGYTTTLPLILEFTQSVPDNPVINGSTDPIIVPGEDNGNNGGNDEPGFLTRGRVIGISLLILLAIGLYYFYQNKYKATNKKVNLLNKGRSGLKQSRSSGSSRP